MVGGASHCTVHHPRMCMCFFFLHVHVPTWLWLAAYMHSAPTVDCVGDAPFATLRSIYASWAKAPSILRFVVLLLASMHRVYTVTCAAASMHHVYTVTCAAEQRLKREHDSSCDLACMCWLGHSKCKFRPYTASGTVTAMWGKISFGKSCLAPLLLHARFLAVLL